MTMADLSMASRFGKRISARPSCISRTTRPRQLFPSCVRRALIWTRVFPLPFCVGRLLTINSVTPPSSPFCMQWTSPQHQQQAKWRQWSNTAIKYRLICLIQVFMKTKQHSDLAYGSKQIKKAARKILINSQALFFNTMSNKTPISQPSQIQNDYKQHGEPRRLVGLWRPQTTRENCSTHEHNSIMHLWRDDGE